MAKRLVSLSGKVIRRSNSELDSDRYEYLSLEQAEPNPGNPDSDRAFFFSTLDGTRGFTTRLSVSGISFRDNTLLSVDTSAQGANGIFIPAFFQDPGNTLLTNDDSVGYLQLGDLSLVNEEDLGLQRVTETGNVTNQGIVITNSERTNQSYHLEIVTSGYSASTGEGGNGNLGLLNTGDTLLQGTLNLEGPIRSTDTDLKLNLTGLDRVEILTYNPTSDSVGYKASEFAFVAPRFDQVTDRSITADPLVDPSTVASGAITDQGINVKFIKLSQQPSPTTGDPRKSLFWISGNDSVRYRELRDFALYDSTNNEIIVRNNLSSDKLFVTNPTVGTLPASGTIPLVFWRDPGGVGGDEYSVVDIDVENLDANFETLKSVTARKAIGLDSGETDELATFSGGIRLRGTAEYEALYPNNTSREVLVLHRPEPGYLQDSAYVEQRTADPIAFNGSLVNIAYVLNNDNNALSNELYLRGLIADSVDIAQTLEVSGNADFDGHTTLDSVTIDAGAPYGVGFKINNILPQNETLILAVASDGTVSTRDLDQTVSEATNNLSLNDVVSANTSSGRTTELEIGAQAIYIRDKNSTYVDNDNLYNFNIVIDSDRNFYVQDKIFFNDLNNSEDQRFLPESLKGDRNYIRFSDPLFAGYPGVFDFISDDSDKSEAVGNALLRAGGLILTDSATIGTNLTITGNLTVNGTTTYINTQDLYVTDKKVVIADNATGAVQAADAGIYVGDDVSPIASLYFDGGTSWKTGNEDFTVSQDLYVEGYSYLDSVIIDGGINIARSKLVGQESNVVLTIDNSNEVSVRTVQPSAFLGETLTTVTDPLRPTGYDSTGTPLYFRGGIRSFVDQTNVTGEIRLLVVDPSTDSVEYYVTSTDTLDGEDDTLQSVTTRGPTTDQRITASGYIGDSATLGTAKISDLTKTRVVFVSDNGRLVDDTTFTYDSASNILAVDNIDIATEATLASAIVEDLTDDRVVISGTGGALEDDANLTFDGTSLNVGVNLDVDGVTTLDSTTIEAGSPHGVGLKITNLASGNGAFVVVDGTGQVSQKSEGDAFANQDLQEVTNKNQITYAGSPNVSNTTNKVRIGGDFFLGTLNDLLSVNSRKSLHIASADSVGYRDQGALAYLDSDNETFRTLTSKPQGFIGNNQLYNNTAVNRIELISGLNLKNVPENPDGNLVALFLHQDSVVKASVDQTVFRKPTLEEVTTAGDSTKILTKFGGNLLLHEYGTGAPTGSNYNNPGGGNYYQMLIINDDTNLVARANIGSVMQVTSTETLETVTTRGAGFNLAAGKTYRDSAYVNVDFGGFIYYSGASANQSSSTDILVLDDDNRISQRSLDTIIDAIDLDDVTTADPRTDNPVKVGSVHIFTQGGSIANDGDFDEVIDQNRNAFFADLDAAGVTTLDSTTIDAGIVGDGFSIQNLGTSTTNTDVLTINGDIVKKTAFSNLYQVPNLQSVTEQGHVTTLEIQALGVRADSATIAGNVEVGNNLTVLGSNTYLGLFNYINHQAQTGSSYINVRTAQSPVLSHFIGFDSANNGGGDDYTKMRFGVKSINDGSITNQLVLDGKDGPKVTTDYTSTDFTIDNATNSFATASKILFTSGNTSGADAEYPYGEITTVFTGRTAGNETARMELRVSGTSDFATPDVRIRIDSDGEVLITDTEKLKLDTGVKLQDANNRTLVIYDSAGAVLWGNV